MKNPRMWEVEMRLTEVEGRVAETMRVWMQAQNNPKLRSELLAQEVIVEGLLAARDGEQALINFGSDMGLTAKETVALQVVAGFVKRSIKQDRQDRRRRCKPDDDLTSH